MKLSVLLLIFLLVTSCSSKQSTRSVASEGIYRTLILNKGFSLRAEDQNGNLEFVYRLNTDDIVQVNTQSKTGTLYYINDGDILESNGGWFSEVYIKKTKGISEDRREELNQRKLFVSVSVVNHSIPVNEKVFGFDCQVIGNQGCLLKRESDTVVIYYRGWVPDLRFGGSHRGRIPRDKWRESARQMFSETSALGDDVNKTLAEIDLNSSIFATGSSSLRLNMKEIEAIMDAAGASKVVLASHSGGYLGMRKSIAHASKEFLEDRVIGLWMLDNFYSISETTRVLNEKFSKEFLVNHCFGHVTDHNKKNYLKLKQSAGKKSELCSSVITQGVSHGGGVIQCLPYFENAESCSSE